MRNLIVSVLGGILVASLIFRGGCDTGFDFDFGFGGESVDMDWIQKNTTEFKQKDVSRTAKTIVATKKATIHPPTNNPVHPDTEKVVGERTWNEEVRYFQFGTARGQNHAFGISFGSYVWNTFQDVKQDFERGELDIIKGHRTAGEQFFSVWLKNRGKAGPLPFKGVGGHAIGRAVDFHASFVDERVPLGRIGNSVVWYGTRPKGKLRVRDIKGDPKTKNLVLKWIKDVRFAEEFKVLETLPGYDEEKCLDWAYDRVRWLIASNLEGAHMVAFEYARRYGLTGAACTRVQLGDAGHYQEIQYELDDDEGESKRGARIRDLKNCKRGSSMWNDYYYRSVQKADPSLKWEYEEELKEKAPGLILFPRSRCTS